MLWSSRSSLPQHHVLTSRKRLAAGRHDMKSTDSSRVTACAQVCPTLFTNGYKYGGHKCHLTLTLMYLIIVNYFKQK